MVYANDEKRRENNRKKTRRKIGTKARKAGDSLRHAVASGKIKKPKNCSNCGNSRNIQGHHEDHEKPFDVIWLCRECHVNLHKDLYIKSGGLRSNTKEDTK